MKTVNLEIEPGELVSYSDFQFGNLNGARLDCVEIRSFGLYAVLSLNDERFTVPYNKINKFVQ